jgi:TRAP-type C4-dicarboxylate transport system permease small subunit
MAVLEKFNRFNEKVTTGIEWVGLVAFVFMMLLTTVDVIGAKIFLAPVPGALDLMDLAQLTGMSFALGASYYANRHVEVEFFVPLMPRFLQHLSACLVRFLMVVLFIVMTWQLFGYAQDLKAYGEVSPTVRIPLYPFAYGAAVAFIPACLVSLAKFTQSLVEVLKR